MTTYVFKRYVEANEWVALPRSFEEGDVVTRGSDSYGLCRDDWCLGDRQTVPCTIDGSSYFFTCPVEFLQTLDGKDVLGDYF